MDEVDGLGAGDRGGLQALVKIIKQTLTPIICICNDRQDRRLQTLCNHTYDLKFQRPSTDLVKQKINLISKHEKLDITDAEISNLVESSGSDIRQVINTLQLWKYNKKCGAKDGVVMINNFDAAHKLLNFGVQDEFVNFRDKVDLVFVDYEWIPLLIQESYLTSMEKRDTKQDINQMA